MQMKKILTSCAKRVASGVSQSIPLCMGTNLVQRDYPNRVALSLVIGGNAFLLVQDVDRESVDAAVDAAREVINHVEQSLLNGLSAKTRAETDESAFSDAQEFDLAVKELVTLRAKNDKAIRCAREARMKRDDVLRTLFTEVTRIKKERSVAKGV